MNNIREDSFSTREESNIFMCFIREDISSHRVITMKKAVKNRIF